MHSSLNRKISKARSLKVSIWQPIVAGLDIKHTTIRKSLHTEAINHEDKGMDFKQYTYLQRNTII